MQSEELRKLFLEDFEKRNRCERKKRSFKEFGEDTRILALEMAGYIEFMIRQFCKKKNSIDWIIVGKFYDKAKIEYNSLYPKMDIKDVAQYVYYVNVSHPITIFTEEVMQALGTYLEELGFFSVSIKQEENTSNWECCIRIL